MFRIYYSFYVKEWPTSLFEASLKPLPFDEAVKARKFVRWQDRQACILGKLLLHYGLRKNAFDPDLSTLKYTPYHKPYFTSGPYFNISHSEGCVVCAISSDYNVGIDLEVCKETRVDDFREVYTTKEWAYICQQPAFKTSRFYEIWTRKEAIVKADGKGLMNPLEEIDTLRTKVCLNKVLYELKPLSIAKGYACHLACENTQKAQLKKISTVEELLFDT
ncbi:4'-phosphopantetheinyl transferase superfamily protein [Rapidithrix thailandica]|uniref:4'-phosphopantetheinyl transferase superfamily protein n=1 Tax=Rapidithrix thailandica TaxID=413964 RepID=A0AAW9SKL3_9BACT